MNFDRKNYRKFADAHAKKSPILKNCIRAFVSGGLICTVSQGLTLLYSALGAKADSASLFASVSLILAAAVLTGLGLFERIAKVAGAGTLVPITGFANAVVSPAIDNKSEGLILGVGAKIFTVAGPVILYAVLSGTAFGVIYYITTLFI